MVDELGSSAVAYSPTIIDPSAKSTGAFTPTFIEWLYARGQQITSSASIVNGASTATLYTVPSGYMFFLTSAAVSMETGAAPVGSSPNGIRVTGTGLALHLICSIQGVEASRNANLSRSFITPIQIPEAGVISLICNLNPSRIVGTIEGFIIKKDQIPQF